jgi:alpha-galactosidase
MWAMNKSPLIIGAALDATRTSKASLDIMSNQDVIAINQDPLAEQARLVRRYTEEEWDVWLGELSSSRRIVGVANWRNDSQIVELDLKSLGISSAKAKDVWSAKNLGLVSGKQTIGLAGHELRLWLLSEIVVAPPLQTSMYHSAANASLSGPAHIISCTIGACLPTGAKVGNINSSASVTFHSIDSQTTGKRLLGIDFVNYDYAFTSAWEWGDNTRNMTIAVNGGEAKRWAFPLSGGDWAESGRLVLEVDGFTQDANNSIIFRGFNSYWAPDLVGFELLQ